MYKSLTPDKIYDASWHISLYHCQTVKPIQSSSTCLLAVQLLVWLWSSKYMNKGFTLPTIETVPAFRACLLMLSQ